MTAKAGEDGAGRVSGDGSGDASDASRPDDRESAANPGPSPGNVLHPAPGLRLVRAPNPSPMTFTGTNTWIVGTGEVAVIDPGPDDPVHLEAILGALAPKERVSDIFVTHAHRDHSPLAASLSRRTGAPVRAAGNMAARRRPIMQELALSGLAGGGEGADTGFAPSAALEDGEIVKGATWHLRAIATPGHTADHLSFAWGSAIFTGDLVMGWASSLVSPPDGDLVSFMASCRRLSDQPAHVFYPGHGDPIDTPADRLAWLIAHRDSRTKEITHALRHGPQTPHDLTRTIYTDIPAGLLPAAERNVLAHLVALVEGGRVQPIGPLSARAEFTLT